MTSILWTTLRAWLSGITGPCQGPVGVSITPARTKERSEFVQAGDHISRTMKRCYSKCNAPVAQRIEYRSSEPWMWVRFLPGALDRKT